jgi:hypothetical protein
MALQKRHSGLKVKPGLTHSAPAPRVLSHCRYSYLIRLDSLRKKTPNITPKKRTVQPGDAFEDTAFKPGFEIVRF